MNNIRNLLLGAVLVISVSAHAQECYDLSGPSSWISLVCHHPDGRMLIRMQGNDYVFCGVPSWVFAGLVSAASPGSYYDTHIRGRYSCY
jgi:hypothetical protein